MMHFNHKFIYSGILTSIIVLGFFFAFSVPIVAEAAIPQFINYQSRLRDSSSNAITATTTIRFAIYNDSSSGVPTSTPSSSGPLLWSEIYDQSSGSCSYIDPDDDGYFTVQLGTCTSFPDYLDFDTSTLYVGVTIESDIEASPRAQLGVTPYAFTSEKVLGAEQSAIGTTTPVGNSVLTVEATSTSAVAVSIRGFASQVADLFRIITDTGTQLLTFTSGGNLGVGTSTPVSKLSLSDTGDTTLTIAADSDNSGEDDNATLLLSQDGNLVSGLFGINGSIDARYTGALANAVFLEAKSGGVLNALQFVTGGTSDNTDGTVRMTIDVDGNVGIGTTSPYAKLSVVGEIVAEYFTATSTTATSTLAGGLNVGSGGLLYDFSSGNVGIGTITPNEKFVVSGESHINGLFDSTLNSEHLALSVGSDVSSIKFGDGNRFSISTESYENRGGEDSGDSELLTILSSGNVGIGTTSPYARLSVVGEIVAEYFTATSTSATSTFPWLASTIFALGSDYFTDLTGDGLILSSGVLTVATSTFNLDPSSIDLTQGYTLVGDSSGNASATSTLFVSSAGNVGIGTTSPFSTLSVAGSGFFNDSLTASNITATGTLAVTGTATFSGDIFSGTKNLASYADFYNGSFLEQFNATTTSDGSIVTMHLGNKTNSGDLTMRFSTGDVTLTAPTSTALSVGSDVSPTENYVYLTADTQVLTVSTDHWPADTEHIKIAYFLVPSASFVQTYGTYVTQDWNDGAEDSDGQGHMTHMAERSRYLGAVYHDGIDGNGDGATYVERTDATPDTVYIKTASGVIYQLHEHAVPAYDTSGSDIFMIPNSSVSAYETGTDLYNFLSDSGGTTMSDNYYNLVLWAVANKSGEYAPLMVNLPTCSYASQSAAEQDTSGCDDFAMPDPFSNESGTGFLIARLTMKHTVTGSDLELISTTDLRGLTPQSASGGTAGGNLINFADNQFTVYDETDSSKVLTFDVGSLITTGNTRALKIPDLSGTIGLLEAAQTWTGVNTFSNTSVFTGNVGIGTTSPYAKLSVVGETVAEYFTATSTSATSTLPWLSSTIFALGSDYFTDLTGNGLTITGNALTVATSTFDLDPSLINLAQGYTLVGDSSGNASATSTLYISSMGNIGIGTTSPYAKLSVVGEIVASYFTATSTTATSTFAGGLAIETSGLVYDYSTNRVGIGTASPGNTLTVNGDTEITNGSGLIIGNSSQITTDSATKLQVLGTDGSGSSMTLGRFANDIYQPQIEFVKSRSTTIGGNAIVQDGDVLGGLHWHPDDGVDYATSIARFVAQVDDASPAEDDIGAEFKWSLMPGGGGAIATVMMLRASGNLGIGDSTPTYKLDVAGDGHFTSFVDASYFTATSTTATSTFAGGLNVGSGGLVYDYSSGNVGIGTTSPFTTLSVSGNGYFDGTLTASGNMIASDYFVGSKSIVDPESPTPYGVDNTDLVGYWTANGNAKDYSGYGNDGTLTGGATSTDAVFGKGFEFDGTDDHVDIGDVDAYEFSSSFTVSVWVKIGNVAGTDTVVSKGGGGPSGWMLAFDSSEQPYIQTNSLSAQGSAITQDEWHHLVAGYDGTDLFLYVDGSLADTQTTALTQNTTKVFSIGSQGGTESNFLNGSVDEVMLFERQLSFVEIQALYSAGIKFKTSGSYVYYEDNVGIGTTTPSANLVINGTTGQNLFQIATSTNQSILTVNENGYIGIGDSTPSYALDVDGAIRVDRVGSGSGSAALVFEDSRAADTIYHTVSADGNYNILLGVNNDSQYVVNNDGAAKVLFTGHGGDGEVSLNAAQQGTIGSTVSYNIGLSLDSVDQYLRIGNPGDSIGLWNTAGNIIADVDGDLVTQYLRARDGNGLNITDDGGNLGIFIKDGGNVGIGTTSPYAKLSVVGETVAEYFTATSTTATSTFPWLASTIFSLGSDYFTDLTGVGLTITGNALTVATSTFNLDPSSIDLTQGYTLVGDSSGNASATSTLFISSAGNVGVGTVSPNSPLHVFSDTESLLQLTRNTDTQDGTAAAGILFGVRAQEDIQQKGAILFKRTTGYGRGDLVFAVDSEADNGNATLSDAVMTLQSGGNVGIGTTSPYAKLSVWGGSSGNIFEAATNASSTALVIDSSGNVGIGITIPLHTLTVDGSIEVTDALQFFDGSTQQYASLPFTNSWHLSTAKDSGTSYDVSSEDALPRDITFKPDGLTMFMVGDTNDKIFEYTLSIPWDLSSTITLVATSTVSFPDTSVSSAFFKPDGTKMFYIDNGVDDIHEYTLSTAWDITTLTFVQSYSVAEDTSTWGLFFKPDGKKMYIAGDDNDNIYEYTLSVPWDLGSTITNTASFSVASEEGSVKDIYFRPDGTKMYTGGTISENINEYTVSTPWDLSSATASSVVIFDPGIINPSGIYIKPDGSKMYLSSISTDAIHEYDLGFIVEGGGNVGIGTTTPVSKLSLSDTGDTTLTIAADSDNTGEDDNPTLLLSQDGNAVSGLFGINGLADTRYTGALANALYIEAKSAGTVNDIQFVTGGTSDATDGTARMTIDDNGYVGIGDTTPDEELTVVGGICAKDLDTDTCSTAAGAIDADGAITANNFDLAENFLTDDDTLSAGEIVTFDLNNATTSIVRATSTGVAILGVVSTAPSLVMGYAVNNAEFDENKVRPVALIGRVPVIVNDEGGAISVGDRLKLSSTAGQAMYSFDDDEDQTIGIALEEWSGVGTTTVTMFIDNNSAHRSMDVLSIDSSYSAGDVLYIGANGNFGIGTSSPYAKLSVSGDVVITDNLISSYFTATSTTATSTLPNISLTSLLFGSDYLIDITGVGLTLSDGALTVATSTFNLDPSSIDLAQGYLLTGGSDGNASATSTLYIASDGSVGIGTTSPSAQLHTTGTVRFENFGSGTLTTDASGNVSVSSDERLKNITGNFDKGLEALLGLSPVIYKWNATSTFETSSFYSGFTAQNVQEFIPEAVGQGPNGYLTLSDRPIIAATVNAIKELNLNLENIASTTATSTPASESFVSSFFSNIFAKITEWFADATNGITDVFANVFHAKEKICVDGECLTKDDIRNILDLVDGQSASVSASIGSEDADSVDTEAPIIDILGKNPAEIAVSASYSDLGVTVTDNVNDNLGHTIQVNGVDVTSVSLDTDTSTTYTITYTATDQAGNVGTAERTVIVGTGDDATPPEETTATTTPEVIATTTPEVVVIEPTPEPEPIVVEEIPTGTATSTATTTNSVI